MIDMEKQQQELEALDIHVCLIDNVDGGFTILYNNKKYIVTNKNYDDVTRYWIIEHELSHNMLKNLYDASTPTDIINAIEQETNEDVMFRHELPLLYILNGNPKLKFDKEKFCKVFKITEELYDVTEHYVMFEIMREVIKDEKHN